MEAIFFPPLTSKNNNNLILFPTGSIYRVKDDFISKVDILVDTIVCPKSQKIYKQPYINFNYKKISVAKLMASNFVKNPNNYLKIKRIDGNIQNNSSNNFEWVRDNKVFERVKIEDLLKFDYTRLSEYHRAAYDYVVKNDESSLYRIIYLGKMKRYLYKSFFDRGLPKVRFEDFLDDGYDALKDKLKKYYKPSYEIGAGNKFRKYCFLTMYFHALSRNHKEPLISLSKLPRELQNNKYKFDEECSLYDMVFEEEEY